MRGCLRRLAWLGLALAVLVYAGSRVIEDQLASRASLYQRVEVSAESQLFGEKGTPIGTPQEMIINDPKAILPGEEHGAKLVDEKYLREQGIYPLQLKTVRFFGHWSRIGAAVAAGVCVLLLFLARKRGN